MSNIIYLDKPYEEKEIFASLDIDVQEWFKAKYKHFTPPQRYSVKLVAENKNLLISSPTGTGKTMSAFLGIISRLVTYAKEGTLENRVYTIYISPLKSLGNDIEKNLEEPLREIEELCKKNGRPMMKIRHAVRSGDTTSYEKQKMNKHAPHILITTPESLSLILCAPKFKEKIEGVESIIIDEIHALAENKRGTHLALSLERLNRLANFTRIGLSATISPLDDVARYLVGQRECCVVDVSYLKKRDLKVLAPEVDPLTSTPEESSTALYNEITRIVNENTTTLIFTNTRSGTESVVLRLKQLLKLENVDESIVAHHSSLSKEQRLMVENILKSGKAKVVVSSTSLELGIDIGSVDVVIQIGSPKSIARCLQRVGRAGHNMASITKGYFICPDYDDLIEVAVMLQKSYEHKIDSISIPKNALDVLSQHLMGMSLEKVWNASDAYDLVIKSFPYKDLKLKDFIACLNFLAGNEELDKSKVYGKIWYDREKQVFGKRGKLAKLIYMSNIGTIPDETRISVMSGKDKIGYVEEAFVERLKKNDIFSLGGNSYIFRAVSGLRIKVDPAPFMQPTIPRWVSEQLPLNFDLAQDIRIFRERIFTLFSEGKDEADILKAILEMPVDKRAAKAIYRYMNKEYTYLKKQLGTFSYSRETWLLEYYESEQEGFKIIFHTLYGRRVNDALSRIIAFLIGEKLKKSIAISINDNGFILHMPKVVFFDPDILKGIDIEDLLKKSLDKSDMVKRRFRHVASRGLMILRKYKGYSFTVGRQQMTATTLFNLIKEMKDFPFVIETYREIMEDYLDVNSLKQVLLKERDILRIEGNPSPFSHNLLVQGSGDVVSTASRKELLRELDAKLGLI